MATAIRAENAADVTISSTDLLVMRVTAVRACRVYFRLDCLGIDPTDNKCIYTCYRGRTDNGGSAITPTALDSSDADTVGNLATFKDTSATGTGGTKVDYGSIHPQNHGFTLSHKLAAGETLDLNAKVQTADTYAVRATAVVRDLN